MIVGITAYNRPNYLRLLLESLQVACQQIDEPMVVVARVEPSDVQDDIIAQLDNGRGWYVTVNEEQLGHVTNIRKVFEDGFKIGKMHGEDFVVWFADDLIVSPDGLACTAYMRDTFAKDEQVVSTALHWQRSEPQMYQYKTVGLRANIHNSQGHGIWRRSWDWHLGAWEPVTGKRVRGIDPPGYRGNDQCISARLRADDKRQAAPLLARVYSIGVEDGIDPAGMHATAKSLAGDNPSVFSSGLLVDEHPWRIADEEDLRQVTEAWSRYEEAVRAQT